MNRDDAYLIPSVFTRHKLHLHALLLQNQPWFSARDLGRLLRLLFKFFASKLAPAGDIGGARSARKLSPTPFNYLGTALQKASFPPDLSVHALFFTLFAVFDLTPMHRKC